MLVDIVSQQQLTEVFTTNHSHHRSSSSSSSSTHRRSSSTVNLTSSSTSSNQSSMTNGRCCLPEELGKKAEQILGQAMEVVDYCRQPSTDLHGPRPLRLNITKPDISSRNNALNTTSSTGVNNSSGRMSTPSATIVTSDSSQRKNRTLVTVEQLVPFIFQLVALPKLAELPEMISRNRSKPQPIENAPNSREISYPSYETNDLQLSDDENEDEDDNEQNNNTINSNSVLIDTTDKKIKNDSINQNNSNDNPPHLYENQTEIEHSGQSSSRYEEDDSEDDDSDNQEPAHSDAENDDPINATNQSTWSLIDFVLPKNPLIEPADSSLKYSSESLPPIKKRSISPDDERIHDNHVHNTEDHQNKRKKLLIKRKLLKSFVSAVNTKIDIKRPSLPITIPTHLLFDQSTPDVIKSNDEPINEPTQRASKRTANGNFKTEINTDQIDGKSQSSNSVSANNQSNTQTNSYKRKSSTSHLSEKIIPKSESSTNNSSTLKNESMSNSTFISSQEVENRNRTNTLSSTVSQTSVGAIQPKKEKPTANVKPLQQSAPMDNLSSGISFNMGGNSTDNLTANSTRSMLPSTKTNYEKLKKMSKTDLTALARKKKKQADTSKRTTFFEAREAMSLYLESVCYFVQCANEESKLDQRTALLTTTLTMLQQLVYNQQKLFCVSNQTVDSLFNIRQKFLLINYWLQSLIYHLQFNTNMPNIERSANLVTEYFHQLKNPSSAASLSKSNTTISIQQQSTPVNDGNPISPLSVASQASASDSSTISANQQQEQHRYIYDFSKLMLNSYYSTYYWNKAERLVREKSLKEFTEQLGRQNQNRRLSRDDTTIDFLLYMFDAIELLRVSVA